jgi:hypothetical protein
LNIPHPEHRAGLLGHDPSDLLRPLGEEISGAQQRGSTYRGLTSRPRLESTLGCVHSGARILGPRRRGLTHRRALEICRGHDVCIVPDQIRFV